MEYVEVLREIKQINSIKKHLRQHSERDYILFTFGINTGLKITELLDIKVSDVVNNEGKVLDFYMLPTKIRNTSDYYEIYLNSKIKKSLQQYIHTYQLTNNDYLFLSLKTRKPITRQHAYRIIRQAAEAVGIEGKIGTNSMRKTFGFHAFKRGVAISLLQKHFHHATPSETLRYIGIHKGETIRTEIDVNL